MVDAAVVMIENAHKRPEDWDHRPPGETIDNPTRWKLLPILWGTGAGSEVMSRIAAPMIGGMITAPLLSLFIIPAAYKLICLRRYRMNSPNSGGASTG